MAETASTYTRRTENTRHGAGSILDSAFTSYPPAASLGRDSMPEDSSTPRSLGDDNPTSLGGLLKTLFSLPNNSATSPIEGNDDSHFFLSARGYGRFVPQRHIRVAPVIALKPLKVWYGNVLDVYRNTFVAQIEDQHEGGIEQAEIPFKEVDVRDRPLIRRGAPFIWSVGYLLKPSGQETVSKIRMRRIANVTSDDFEMLDKLAEEEFGILDDDE